METEKSANSEPANLCVCNSQKVSSSTLPNDLSVTATPGSLDVNALADSLGVSPLYRQIDSARWSSAAQIYHSSKVSRAHSPILTAGNFNFDFGDQVKSPLSNEVIANMNRGQNKDNEEGGILQLDQSVGQLELEAISALHELTPFVDSISVSDILPKTAELIFLNVKTKEDLPFTLELTMKGWRICSNRTDCMYGDYLNFDFYTHYYHNAKEVLKVISPENFDHFADCLIERLKQLKQSEEEYRNSLTPNSHENQEDDESIVSIPVPRDLTASEIDDETMFL